MKRRYFVTAHGVGNNDVYAEEISADSFADALITTLDRAEKRFGGRVFRLTSIVEQPELAARGPISIALDVFRGRALL